MDNEPGDINPRRDQRIANGLTKAAISRKSGLNAAQVTNVEKGKLVDGRWVGVDPVSVAKYDRAVSELIEEQASGTASTSLGRDTVEIEVTGDFGVRSGNLGVRIYGRGPVDNLAEIRAAIAQLVDSISVREERA